jgi:hypothetical protein
MAAAVEIQGTLQPDGTLVLDEKPNVPPGRVRVTVQSVPAPPQADLFWATLRAIWDGQENRGHAPRDPEAIEAERRALREGMDEEIDEAVHLQEECRRLRQQSDAAEGEGK